MLIEMHFVSKSLICNTSAFIQVVFGIKQQGIAWTNGDIDMHHQAWKS